MLKNVLIAIAVASLALPGLVFGQVATDTPTAVSTPDLQTIITQLQTQVRMLQAQVEVLKAQVASSTIEIQNVKTELAFTRILQRGTTGDEVKKLQEFLKQFSDVYPEGLVTGYYGPLTETAVKKFQEKQGIESVGIVGPRTLAKLNEFVTTSTGQSEVIPSGFFTAPGIQKKVEVPLATTTSTQLPPPISTSTLSVASTTSMVATTTLGVPSPSYSSPSSAPTAQPTPTSTSSATSTATTTTASTTATTTSSLSYGSALNLSNVSDVFGKIWGPGSNGIIMGGGLNFSTQVGIGWSQQYGGVFATSYSIQGVQVQYLTQTNPVLVTVTGPAGSVIEVWNLETLKVVGANITNSGSPVTFTAQPNTRYGGFGWYADNSQKNIEIHAVYSSSSSTTTATPTLPPLPPITVTGPNGGETWQYNLNYRLGYVLNGVSVDKIGVKLLRGSDVVYETLTSTTWGDGTFHISLPGVNLYSSVGSGSNYKIRIYNKDNPGVYDDSDNYFTILPTDIVPPVVSSVLASSTTANSAVITWTTDEPATGFVNYGSTPLNWAITPSDYLVTAHSFALSNLTSSTLYTFRVYSTDAQGNSAVLSTGYPPEYTFTTASSTSSTLRSSSFYTLNLIRQNLASVLESLNFLLQRLQQLSPQQ